MKKIMGIIIFSVFCLQKTDSQTSGFPQGNSTVYLLGNKQIKDVTLWRLHHNQLEYKKYGNLHDVDVSKIEKIKSGEEYFSIVNDSILRIVNITDTESITSKTDTSHADFPFDSTEYFSRLGSQDANKYYSGTGAFIGGLLMPIISPVIAVIPPDNPGRKNPDANLYYSNREYNKAFKKTAHNKKAINVAGGLGTFLILVILFSVGEY